IAVGATALVEAPPPEKTAPAVEAKASPDSDAGLETWTVPLASIDAEGSPFRFRRTLKPDAGIRGLAASIEAQGLLHPLTVRKQGERFELVSGFRRHAALSFLSRTKGIAPSAYPVKVSVLPDGTSDDEALRVSIDENLSRKSLDSTEKAMAVVKLRDEFGKTTEEIGSMLRLSETQIRRLTDLLAAPEDVREAFRAGRFSLRHAISLARVQDRAARESVIRRAEVKRIRGVVVASAAEPAGGEALEAFPEAVRAFARLSRTEDPAYPFRVTVRLRSEEEVSRLSRLLGRFASGR
ncbi:MAG: ParB/RepB/Spo0J family partition protein, partial [Planctomycetes bacterium]|nr:ParB/RepB/Spo0J family partition protein [Planctomycetota bacterium]